MKQKKIFILAAAALAFAACSSDESPTAPEQAQAEAQAGEMPIAFDAYVNRATTRAGVTNDVDQTKLESNGFGIFAYYTNSDTYDPIFTPNFMYNQKVSKPSTWTYTPVKYWPNEFTTANAEENDKVSFFAYAPYVTCNASTGKIDADKDWGIVGFTRNTAAGDPLVKYVASFDLSKQVDLLWGVVGATEASSGWAIKQGSPQSLEAGKPWLDIQHPANLDQAMKFTFNHALSRVIVDVDLYADAVTANAAATGTKVYIRSVTFTGFATKGALNLNNVDAYAPLWLSNDGQTDIESGVETTIYDGRKDGKEGLFAASNEKAFINPLLTQTTVWDDGDAQPGVTQVARNLFSTTAGSIAPTDPIYVIPNGDPLKVTIVYDVMTEDSSLPGYLNDGKTHGSVVTNTITKNIQTTAPANITLQAKTSYEIHLHIGLNAVDVDAAVEPWGDATEGSADLPINTVAP